MVIEVILIAFALLYYMFCVVFLCENLEKEIKSIIDVILTLVFILITAPIQVPILLAIFLSRRYKKMMK